MPAITRALVVACLFSGTVFSSHALATVATFTPIAREFVNNVGLLNVNVPVAISADGKAAFAAGYQSGQPGTLERIFTYDGALGSIDLPGSGFSQIRSVQVNASGNIAFGANRHEDVPAPLTYRGVYSTTVSPSGLTTILERPLSAQSPAEGGPVYNIDLTEGNKIAFSTIINGTGALYRGSLGGPLEVLRTGTGTFYNTKQVATNETGTVAVQIEHFRPFGGLGRGILAFDTPMTGGSDAAVTAKTAVEQGNVGLQPAPVMNNNGVVAFSLDTALTMTFYVTPNNYGGPVLTTQTLQPGVYTGVPNAYGIPKNLTMIADDTGPFNTFGRVQINDAGAVVFEATTDGPGGISGIFTGGDPVLDKVVALGDSIGPIGNQAFVSALYLGELNNAGQFTMITSDFISTDRQVWIVDVSGVPEPASLGLMMVGVAGLLVRRRR